jgi:hypothetical protein
MSSDNGFICHKVIRFQLVTSAVCKTQKEAKKSLGEQSETS